METIKVESKDKESQGSFVLINKKDFDEKKHKLYKEQKQQPGKKS